MKLNKIEHRLYDVFINSLAVVTVVLTLIDVSDGLNLWQGITYKISWGIFLTDYIIRFTVAKDRKKFFKHNFSDFIALIPFHGIFNWHVVGMAGKILRYMNLLRIVALLCRPVRKAERFYNTNGFKYVIIATIFTIITGGILIHYAEGMTFQDGIWWSFVTATTVGYGDISPSTLYGRLIATVLMVVGIGLIGSLTSTLTSFFMRKPNTSVKKQTIELIKDKLDHFEELSEKDVDDLCTLIKSLTFLSTKK